MPSPFLSIAPVATVDSLAILHLKRDLLVPTYLQDTDPSDPSHADEKVTNTRFGSFPHSTLINVPWGAQVLASKVDAGSRSRKNTKKRKRVDGSDAEQTSQAGENGSREAVSDRQAAQAASSGFVHLLPPTPETWTMSLPHRTQVVYTPDYSYVLQRLRVRPGDTIIEAGAGSGCFTHAAARAVFSGFPGEDEVLPLNDGAILRKKRLKTGKVYSFEFHELRAQQLQEEIKQHGLDGIVKITHRDVYEEGFSVDVDGAENPSKRLEPQADAIFLDLPAPWFALKHLSRAPPASSSTDTTEQGPNLNPSSSTTSPTSSPSPSPLNPKSTVRICTFSPCIEQVQRTVSSLRELGWVDIDMVEVAHRRLDVRRERIGLQEEGLRGVIPTARTVDEAVGRLREVESKWKNWNETQKDDSAPASEGRGDTETKGRGKTANSKAQTITAKQQRVENNKLAAAERKTWKEGRLVHRTEPEIKTHTSYLVFAVLPRAWTAEDEGRARLKWEGGRGKERTTTETLSGTEVGDIQLTS